MRRLQPFPKGQRDELEQKTYDTEFYYYTGYGSPLVYVRLLDLVAPHGLNTLSGKRVLDFGYGSIGQMRLMASLGADAVGCEVHPVLRALYSEPGDQGRVESAGGGAGRVTLVDGSWPGDEAVRKAVGGGFDLLTSKNTLKRGYIHPEREVDPRFLVHLGVDDEVFVRRMYDAMNPGGLVLIYNLSPAQNPPDQRYLPHADGRCPFGQDLLERIGFEVIAYDKDDHESAYDIWFALGYNQGETREQLSKSLFAHYTLLRRP